MGRARALGPRAAPRVPRWSGRSRRDRSQRRRHRRVGLPRRRFPGGHQLEPGVDARLSLARLDAATRGWPWGADGPDFAAAGGATPPGGGRVRVPRHRHRRLHRRRPSPGGAARRRVGRRAQRVGPHFWRASAISVRLAEGRRRPARRTAEDCRYHGFPRLMSAINHFGPDDQMSGLLRAIVESSDDAIIGKSLDGIIVSWNGGAQRMYGYAASEAVGQPISLVVPEEHRPELERIQQEIRAGRRVASHETVRMTRAGHRLPVSLTVSPILDARGDVVGASAIARDITESRRLMNALVASEERYRSIVESAVDAILVID